VNLPSPFKVGVEMPAKLYLNDEFGQKYVSEGAVIIDVASMNIFPQGQQSALPPTQITPAQQTAQPQVLMTVRALSYKTEKVIG